MDVTKNLMLSQRTLTISKTVEEQEETYDIINYGIFSVEELHEILCLLKDVTRQCQHQRNCLLSDLEIPSNNIERNIIK
jgi:hypothetical protein